MEVLILAGFLGLIPAFIARSKGHSFVAYYIFGVLLFIVALIVSLCIKPDQHELDRRRQKEGEKKCPHCKSWIDADATVCRHCRNVVEAPVINGVPA